MTFLADLVHEYNHGHLPEVFGGLRIFSFNVAWINVDIREEMVILAGFGKFVKSLDGYTRKIFPVRDGSLERDFGQSAKSP